MSARSGEAVRPPRKEDLLLQAAVGVVQAGLRRPAPADPHAVSLRTGHAADTAVY